MTISKDVNDGNYLLPHASVMLTAPVNVLVVHFTMKITIPVNSEHNLSFIDVCHNWLAGTWIGEKDIIRLI